MFGLTNVEGLVEDHPKVLASLSSSFISDNPLRNSILGIQIETLQYKQTDQNIYVVEDPTGQASAPGIYIIHNTVTNKFWVGESKNIYERIRKHCSELRSNFHPNLSMLDEFKQHSTHFKFYYYKDINLVDRNDRIPYESKIQRTVCLIGPNALYNLKVEDPTKQFAPQRSGGSKAVLRKEPGVLQIFCSQTGKVYYCHSKNLSQKGTQIQNKLRRKAVFNSTLINDWCKYGESGFIFSIVVSGPQYIPDAIRIQTIQDLINKIGIENTYNTEKGDSRKKVVQKLNADGTTVVYSSLSETARREGVNIKTLRKKIQNNEDGFSYQASLDNDSFL